jgi:hypothetical protein
VRNDSSKAVTFATVVATFYDPNGNVLDVAKINSDPENLEPGQSGQFFFTTREWSEGSGSSTLIAEAQVQRYWFEPQARTALLRGIVRACERHLSGQIGI